MYFYVRFYFLRMRKIYFGNFLLKALLTNSYLLLFLEHRCLFEPHRPCEYYVFLSTGFPVVTRNGHKMAACLQTQL